MSANSKKHKKSNRKRQRKHKNITKSMKFMKNDEVDSISESIGRPHIQPSESFKDPFSINEQGNQDFDESSIMNIKSFVKDLNKVESKDQAFIKAMEQMSNKICEKLD